MSTSHYIDHCLPHSQLCNRGGTKEVCLAAACWLALLQLRCSLGWRYVVGCCSLGCRPAVGSRAAAAALGLPLLVWLLVRNIGFVFSRFTKKGFAFAIN